MRITGRRLRPAPEPMESRCLMDGAMRAYLQDGVLHVAGTPASDQLRLALAGWTGSKGGGVQGWVYVNNVGRFRAKRIRAIEVDAGDGNDRILLNFGRWRIQSVLNGGAGNDTVIGGAGRDRVAGGDGNDVIWGSGGNDVFDGGAGRNRINGVWSADSWTPTSDVPNGRAPASSSPIVTTPSTPVILAPPSAIVQSIVDLINQARDQSGLSRLASNPKLTKAAQIHADDMARLERMEHTLPGVAQPTLRDRGNYVNYSFSWLGENIAYNYASATSVMDAWMNSADHRANILNPNFTEIGVAIAYSERGEPYYCQVFGRPA